MEFRAAQIQGYDKVNPKLRLEQLLRTRNLHGYNVPNMEGYEQFGSKIGTNQLKMFINPYEAKDFRTFRLNDYKGTYAQTRKWNTKTQKYELFDSRTGTFFDREKAYEYINLKNSEAAKVHYLKIYGTETPQKDIEYLHKLISVQNSSKKDFLTINKLYAEKYGSKMLEGEDISVADRKDQLRINRLNKELDEKKKGTSFEKAEDAQLEYKINQSVTNQENQPLNIKDINVNSLYNDTRRKQLEIDKTFNTSPSGVVY
jgi:hypothetical protein